MQADTPTAQRSAARKPASDWISSLCEPTSGPAPRRSLATCASASDHDMPSTISTATAIVTTPEPLPADDSLWAAPNVIFTPHNSGSTDGTGGRADEAFLANLERWVAGADLANEVEP